ncbi:sensor histidine kinase [Rossellomorea sp. BNER]|uniref:sensor histidine kinase n=1 Tax=Rossellomorea sp. BNER TaxID=2962031 RepID=UPI003AF305D6|nr:sensor histidine kinase [Rossellomorea sp. BNER]
MKTSIRNKLIVLLLLITILPFGTSIIITYFYTKETLKDQVVQENSNLLYQGKVNLENYINELDGLTLSLYNNPDFLNFIKAPNKENNYTTIETMKNVVQTILYAEDTIKGVQINFANENKVISASRRTTVVFSDRRNRSNQKAFTKAQNSPFNMYIEPSEAKDVGSSPMITIHRALTNIPSSEVLAYISLEISPRKIIDLSQNLYNSDTEEFYIISSNGDLIYRSNNEPTNVKPKWIEKIQEADQEKGTLEWKDDSFNGVMMYDQMESSTGGWFLVKRVPNMTLYESALNVTKINIMFGVIGLCLVVLSTLFVSFKITSPLRILVQTIQEVEKGNMKVQFKSLGNDEIGVLGDRFKQMIEKINHLINREYRLEIENKTNQLKVLQSQINPHFLYNALQSIGTIALKNKVPQVYSLITYLSKIMRYGMDMEEDIVPLHKEISYTRAFLLLQKERFGENLEHLIEVSKEVEEVLVPKMILQPIIENYFKHGFDIREGIGQINLSCQKEGSQLLIQIKDNGVGVSESRLKEIYQNFQEGNLKRNGEQTNIGLKNVYVRLKLYYGKVATLQLNNHKEGGLLVTMRLPISVEGGKNEGNHNR